MTKAFLVVIAWCGIASADPTRVAARLEETVRDRDVEATRALLADTVTLDGVRFTNAACDKRGRVVTSRVLAACLVKDTLAVTTRRTVTPDAVLVTLASGLEIEIVVRDGHVQSMATPTSHGEPAMSPATLEALRTAGTTQLDAIAGVRLDAPASAWLELCLDKRGAVASRFVAGDPHAGRVFRVAIADWRFRPFELRGVRTPACALVSFAFPASGKSATETVPARAPIVATTTAPANLTASQLVALYQAVGKKLAAVDRTAGEALFVRYRVLQVQRMVTDADARERGASQLRAIDQAIDAL